MSNYVANVISGLPLVVVPLFYSQISDYHTMPVVSVICIPPFLNGSCPTSTADAEYLWSVPEAYAAVCPVLCLKPIIIIAMSVPYNLIAIWHCQYGLPTC